MKSLYLISFAAAMVAVTGCASSPRYAMTEPVGPAPAGRTNTPGKGVLQVYSARQPDHIDLNYAVFFEGESFLKDLAFFPAHTDYKIYSGEGQLLMHVRNSRTLADSTPAQVTLLAGRYRVEAKTETGSGDIVTVSLPVVVEAFKATAVHLDGTWTPPANSPTNELVVLPDGHFVGWRADASAPHAALTPRPRNELAGTGE